LSLHGTLWNESLDREIFSTRKETEILIERRRHTAVRPCGVLGQRPHASDAIPWLSRADHSIKPLALVAALG
jgi:hypothetical protein